MKFRYRFMMDMGLVWFGVLLGYAWAGGLQ